MRRSPDQDPEQSAASDDAAPAVRPFPLSLAEFARRVGRAKSTVTELFQGPLAGAKLPSGRVDATHAAVVAFAVDRGIDPGVLTQPVPITLVQGTARRDATTAAPAAPASDVARAPMSPTLVRNGFEDPPNVEELLDMTLRNIERRFGSLTGFGDFVGLRKQNADCKRLELANAETAGTLIDREFVRVHVIGLIGSTYRRLLADAPKTITRRVYSAVQAGATYEDAEKIVRELISSELKGLKEAATRVLRPRRNAEDAA